MNEPGRAAGTGSDPEPGTRRSCSGLSFLQVPGGQLQQEPAAERGGQGMAAAREMSIHILFDNGSNPFVRYNLTPAEFAKEVLKWDRNYILQYEGATGETILHFKAFERMTQPEKRQR